MPSGTVQPPAVAPSVSTSNSLHRTNYSGNPAVPERRYSGERGSPAPPIVVVSPDPQGETIPPERSSLTLSDRNLQPGDGAPPRNTTLNRLRTTTPKDTIPLVGKPPRKQRSSRIVVTEPASIERLPSFSGKCKFCCLFCEIG